MRIDEDVLPTLNAPLLTTLVKWAGQDVADLNEFFTKAGFPQWNQEVWAKEVRNGVCETACCIAGNAVIQSGYVLDYYQIGTWLGDDGKEYADYMADYCYKAVKDGVDDKGRPKFKPVPGAEREFVPEVAMKLLGITEWERSLLFDGDNGLYDVVVLAQAIAETRGVTLDLPQALRDLTPQDAPGRFGSYEVAYDAVMGVPNEASA